MEIFLEKINFEISKAEEYLELNASKNPDVLRILIESLQDSVSLLLIANAMKKSHNKDFSKVLSNAQSMLDILKSVLDRAEGEKKLARTSSSSAQSSVPLDRVEIPKFRGDDPLEFRRFMTLFTDRIDSNSSLSSVEKFMLLKNYLKGEAFDVIDKVPITEQHFFMSLNLLEEMYGDKEKCIDTLFHRMEAIPAVSADEIAEIRKTYWNLEAVLRSLEQYYERVNKNWLLPLVYKEKFVNASSLETERFPEQLGDIRKHVLRIIQERERLASAQLGSFEKSSSRPDSDISIKQVPSEIATTKENLNSVPSKDIRSCIFCFQNHCSEDCTVFPNVFQRKKQIQHLCSKCLQVNHPKKPCLTFEKCDYCHEDSHNRILCPEKCRTIVVDERLSEKLSAKFSAAVLEDPRPTSNEPLRSDFHSTTPLTLRTVIEDPKTGKMTTVRLVMASGCPISLISKSAAVRVGVKYVTNVESMVLLNMAGEIYARATRVPAKIWVDVPYGPPVELKFHVVDEVCSQKVSAPTVAEFRSAHPHLAHIDFPDPGGEFPIEMLIGGDTELSSIAFNCGLLGEKCPPLESGWSLASSHFGWLIVGTDTSNESPVTFNFTIQE